MKCSRLDHLLGASSILVCFLLLAGCMQPHQPPPSQKNSSGLTASLQLILSDRRAATADLASACSAKERTSTAEEAKSFWNTQYHLLVTESIEAEKIKIKAAFAAAASLEERVEVWKEIQKAYE